MEQLQYFLCLYSILAMDICNWLNRTSMLSEKFVKIFEMVPFGKVKHKM